MLLAGCGDGSERAGRIYADRPAVLRRLDLEPRGAAPHPVASSLGLIDVVKDARHWRFDVPEPPKMPRVPGQEPEQGAAMLLFRAAIGDPPLVLSRPGPFDTEQLDELRLTAVVKGRCDLSVALSRDGEDLFVTPEATLPLSDTPAVASVTLAVPPGLGMADTLELRVAGRNRVLGLLALELVELPPGAGWPDPAGPPALTAVGTEARRAEALVAGRPLGARFTAPDDGRLELSLSEAPAAPAASNVELVLRGGGAEVRRSLAGDGRAGWRSLEVDLARFAGGEVELELRTTGERAAWAVGDVVVVQPGARPPPVLLITSDTHRADHLGVADAGVELATPVLDALAARGVLFTDCYATTNVTNPSHIALLTGRHPRDHGILFNNLPLAGQAPTVARAFAAAGYRTFAALSADHLGDPTSGLGAGFDRMSWPARATRDGEPTVDVLEGWLDEAEGAPLFVWLHMFDAHWPYDPPGRFDRIYYPADVDPADAERFPDPPPEQRYPNLRDLRDMGFPRAQYRAEISYLDEQLGRVLERPRFRAAITAFVADHGESLGEEGVYFSHAPLSPRELHVPLIVAWPGAPAGTRVDAPVSQLDVGRTLLELAGVDPGPIPGHSLVHAMEGGGRELPRFAISASGVSAAVRMGSDYLVLQLVERDQPRFRAHHSVRLYDLASDPGAEHDLLEERLERAAALRAHLIDWLGRAEDLGWAGESIEDPALLEQLAELGYVQGSGEQTALWTPDDCAWCRRFE